MEWNVYRYDSNHNKIEKYNIFNHWRFVEDIKKETKKINNKDEFEERLESNLRYFFWTKCEHELVIRKTDDGRIYLLPWCGCRNPEEVKIDVTDETDFDWMSFANEHIAKQIYENEAKIDIFDQVKFQWNNFLEFSWGNQGSIF